MAVTVAAIAVAPALLFAAPALAVDGAPARASVVADDPNDLRVAIAQLMSRPEAGTEVREKGRKALNGTIEEMCAFLATGYRLAQAQDDRVAIAQLMSRKEAGTEVRAKGRALLNNGTPEELRAFLVAGYRLAQAQDDRVALAQLISKPTSTPALRTAARKVLSAGDPEEMRWFLEVGQYQVTG